MISEGSLDNIWLSDSRLNRSKYKCIADFLRNVCVKIYYFRFLLHVLLKCSHKFPLKLFEVCGCNVVQHLNTFPRFCLNFKMVFVGMSRPVMYIAVACFSRSRADISACCTPQFQPTGSVLFVWCSSSPSDDWPPLLFAESTWCLLSLEKCQLPHTKSLWLPL